MAPRPLAFLAFATRRDIAPRYGNTSVVYRGPEAVSATQAYSPPSRHASTATVSTTTATVRVTFDAHTVAGGLQFRHNRCPYQVLRDEANRTTDIDCPSDIDDCIAKHVVANPVCMSARPSNHCCPLIVLSDCDAAPLFEIREGVSGGAFVGFGLGFLLVLSSLSMLLLLLLPTSSSPTDCIRLRRGSPRSLLAVRRRRRTRQQRYDHYRCGWFELQFQPNDTWVNASAALDGDVLVLTAAPPPPAAAAATGARYLYADWPVATLFNGAGFPALPFNLSVGAAATAAAAATATVASAAGPATAAVAAAADAVGAGAGER
jgi:hypothetical protein